MIEEMEAYERAITQNHSAEIFMAPPRNGLVALVHQYPGRVDSWVETILTTEEPRALAQIRNLGLAIASAYSERDAGRAALLFRHLKNQTPPVNVLIGREEVPLYEWAVFKAADSLPISELRGEAIGAFLDDAALQMVTAAAEVSGATAWLDRYIEQLVASEHPASQARALMLSGFRQPNEISDRILHEEWGDGFLGDVAAEAKKSYQRASWGRHWLDLAANTSDPVDFWRFSTLATGIADIRSIAFVRHLPMTELLKSFGANFYEPLTKGAEDRLKKGRDTLFGLKAPRRDIADSMGEYPH
jgi:hypothetical protein